MKSGTKLGIAALAIALGTTVLWFRMTGTVGLPDSRAGFVVAWIGAIGLGIFAFVRGTSIPGALAPLLGVVVSSFLLFTVYISPQTIDAAKSIKVGDTIPHFTAPDGHGETFDSASLNGHLVLIKFFRAHW
ncbi:MAG: peroxiredoxin family protein [Gammaproteobacteria bacterium]|nr:peroxiredoxin family protein [Gammaproteobacteria bacterium]